MDNIKVINNKGEKVEDLKLNKKIFNGKLNRSLLHQAVLMYQANVKKHTASTKDRSEARGGGRKPWRQKGTGRARAGTIRSPLWRGGGVTHGPKPKDVSYRLPEVMLKGALKSAMNDKINDKQLFIIDSINLDSCKTKNFLKFLKGIKLKQLNEKLLIVIAKKNENLKKASGNLGSIKLIGGLNVNAYNVLLAEKLLIEKKAFKQIEDRLSV